MKALIHPDQLKGHLVAVAGAGRSGLSAARLAMALGAMVRLLERNEGFDREVLKGMDSSRVELITGEHKVEHFAGVDMAVVSPGIPVREIQKLIAPGVPVYSELELASWFVHEPIAAVTGTNGKTTTTMLIAHVLEKMGKKVFAGGNLGTPLSEYVLGDLQCDVLVLEISSFQLEGCSGFHPQVGVFLNFSPNHLDHHLNSDEYFQAKAKLFSRQKRDDLAVIALELRGEMEKTGYLKARQVFFVPSSRFECPALSGVHSQANLEAAFQACRYFGADEETFARAINDFSPPAHRQEVFLKYQGKTFVNDSKATTVAAMAAGLEAFNAPVRLFAGGVYKGGDFSELSTLAGTKVVKAYLFGDSREIFEQAWKGKTDMEHFNSLEGAVSKALKESNPGDTLLLCPGTASFDLFKNYEHRGDSFKSLVKKELGL